MFQYGNYSYGFSLMHDISEMTMESYLDQLYFMINFAKDSFVETDIILVSSGAGNAYVNLCSQTLRYLKIYIHPEDFNIWNLLSNEEKSQETLDTYTLYSKYSWAELELLKLGNVFNRASGFMVNTSFLKSISEVRELKKVALSDQDAICVTNEEQLSAGKICIRDSSYLLMSAKLRGKVIQRIRNCLQLFLQR